MELTIDLWLASSEANSVLLKKAESCACVVSCTVYKKGIHVLMAWMIRIMDVLQMIKREEKYGKDMYDAVKRKRVMMIHCSRTVPNENGIQRKNEKRFLFLGDNLIKNRPILRLRRKPTVSESKNRIIDKKYNFHMYGNNGIEFSCELNDFDMSCG
ncbi:hypothetical protein NKR74_09345 [Bacillus sp. 3103sda1]|uniref:hypothetical protein n=1 Tax=Bacillus sp. 3103sda1 TaxID=2953808 RepID=UPI0020A03598|nr:hypothetical protein [Bacillus sp. 3103sda1]MCP1123522.1 hypothetical protein [Bacillus sp. 3103sda1]